MYRFLVWTALLVVLALLGVLGLSALEERPDVVLINGAEVHDLDPGKMSWMHDIRTAYGLWEGLLTMDPRTLAIIPGAASSYTVSPDGRVYTFHLRPRARWSNGDPVTAEDFRFAWFRVLDPATAADYYTFMFLIDGAEAYYQAMKRHHECRAKNPARQPTPPDPKAVGIHALDEHTLRVVLVRRVAYFPELVAFATFLPLHAQSMEKFLVRQPGRMPFYDPDWLKPGNLVTNGPFVLDRWDFQYRLVLVRNDMYWDAANVPSGRIELLANPDVNTAFLTYESGAADVLTNLPEVAGPELIARKRADLHIFPTWGTYYYRFNCKQPPLDDPRVRQALAMSVDRQGIVRHITRRGERAQTSFVTPGLWAELAPGQGRRLAGRAGPGWMLSDDGGAIQYQPAEGLAFDPPAARRLLAQAGYGPGGRAWPDVTLLINESPGHKAIAESVIKMWRDHLGVAVRLDIQISKIASQRMNEHNFDICRSGWFTDYNDPTGFLDMFRKDDGNNDGQFDVPEYDRLLDQAADASDPARRFSLLQQAERILVAEQAGVIPIYQYVGQLMYRPDITGVHPNPKQQIMLKHLSRRK